MAELKSVTIDLKQEDDEEEDYMSDAFLKKYVFLISDFLFL